MENKSVDLVYTENIKLTLRAKFLLSVFCRIAKNKRTTINYRWMYTGENSHAFSELLSAGLIQLIKIGMDYYDLTEKGKFFIESLHGQRFPVFEVMIPEGFINEQQTES